MASACAIKGSKTPEELIQHTSLKALHVTTGTQASESTRYITTVEWIKIMQASHSHTQTF